MPESLALSQTYAHSWMPGGQKDIYGPNWRAFQGISDSGTGLDEIQDTQIDYARARAMESYIFRAQDVRGSAIDSVPLRVWSTDQRGRRSAVPHPAIELLERNVPSDPAFNVYVSGSASLMRYTLLSLDGHGRSGWRFATDTKGFPTEIYWLVPTAFTPLHGYEVRQNVPFGGLQYLSGGQRQTLTPDQVIYFQTDNPIDPIIGTSKVSILRNAINLRAYSQKSNMDFFKHSMRPDWILTGEWKNNEENIERIKRGLRRHYQGESNREPMVLGEGAKAQLLTTSQKDAEWQAMMRIVQEEISAIYGVPVVYLNNMERATYQNIETAKLMLWHDTMMPETKKLAAMLTQRFLYRFWPESRDAGLEFGFDYNTVTGLSEDVARIWERFNALTDRVAVQVERRELTPNQARQVLARLAETLGLDPTPWESPLPDGDTFYLQFGNLPSDQLSVQAIMNIEASRSSSPAAGELIMDVVGAPDAGKNAQRQIARQREFLDQQADQARTAPKQAALEAEIIELKRHPSVVVKTPDPIPIRDTRLAPIQKRVSAKLKVWFQDLQKQSLRSLRNAKKLKAIPPEPESLYDHQAAIDALNAIILDGIVDAGKAAYDASKADYNLDVIWDNGNGWLDPYMGKRLSLIQGIDETTTGALRDALLEGATSGETMEQLADRVSAVFSGAIDNRADVIARTETIQAYASASLASYRAAGITQAQMYDGVDYDPTCAAVNGMVVSLGEAEQLMAEEHPNGTRGVAPVVDLGFMPQAAAFQFNSVGVCVA
jgi:phage portal protein BeeE